MKRTGKEWALRIGILLSGLTVAHLGVTLFLLSDLNSDPFNLFVREIFLFSYCQPIPPPDRTVRRRKRR